MQTTLCHYAGIAFWALSASIVYVSSNSTSATIGDTDIKIWRKKNIGKMCATVCALILLCTLPMELMNPGWDGKRASSIVKQYEIMAESILDGRIDLDYGDMDPKLLEMDNPYDPQAREELGVKFHWDHALYDGKYYMYFGVVPVFVLFLPYRILTGKALPTYRATQIFTALFIIGFFLLLYNLAKQFFQRCT